jgi:hypothetical protein
LWIIVLEMVCAFGLGAFIIWWTWPKKPKGGAGPGKAAPEQKDKAE